MLLLIISALKYIKPAKDTVHGHRQLSQAIDEKVELRDQEPGEHDHQQHGHAGEYEANQLEDGRHTDCKARK